MGYQIHSFSLKYGPSEFSLSIIFSAADQPGSAEMITICQMFIAVQLYPYANSIWASHAQSFLIT